MSEAIVPRKWRPSLGMIVFAVLLAVAALPLAGLFFFRLYENQLIRQTEAELIAQSTVLAAVFARDAEAVLPPSPALPTPPSPTRDAERFHPIEPQLDLTGDDVLERRPDSIPATQPVDPTIEKIGRRVYEIAYRTQDVTLAGFRILDANGTVIAGQEEVGQSLAGLMEVAAALRGEYRSVLRVRLSKHPPPPLYSISRGTGVRIFAAMPVMAGGRVVGVIYASRTPNSIFRHLYNERRKVALAAASVLAVIAIIGLLFARTITRPIHQLIEQTREIGRQGGGDAPVLRHHGTREIALLAQSFADMAKRLSERGAYISTFAAHVSHELKSPLTSIHGAAELLLDDDGTGVKAMEPARRRRFLENMIADTRRLTLLLQRLRDLAQAENPQGVGVTTLTAVVKTLQEAFSALAIHAEGDEEPLAISQDNALILFSHLADNALRHRADELRIEQQNDGQMVRLICADNGEGISDSNRVQVFNAFFTTRREDGGTGMGLHIVQLMLRAHFGSIRLLPSKKGACFEILLPRSV